MVLAEKNLLQKWLLPKEARETKYWLRLMKDTEIIEMKMADSFLKKLSN